MPFHAQLFTRHGHSSHDPPTNLDCLHAMTTRFSTRKFNFFNKDPGKPSQTPHSYGTASDGAPTWPPLALTADARPTKPGRLITTPSRLRRTLCLHMRPP